MADEPKLFTIKREVNITTLLAIALALVSMIFFFSNTQNATQLNAREIEHLKKSDERLEKAMQNQYTEIKNALIRIENKLTEKADK